MQEIMRAAVALQKADVDAIAPPATWLTRR
jgi:hypothetical protein